LAAEILLAVEDFAGGRRDLNLEEVAVDLDWAFFIGKEVVQGGSRFLDDCMSVNCVVFVLFVFGGQNGDKFLADGREPFFLFRCDRDGDGFFGFGGAFTLFFYGGGDLFVNSFSNLSIWVILNLHR
jgi:hypothetical protein